MWDRVWDRGGGAGETTDVLLSPMVSSVQTPQARQAAPSQSAWTPGVSLRGGSVESQRLSHRSLGLSCARSTAPSLSLPGSRDACLALFGAQGEQAGSQDPACLSEVGD